MKEQEKNVKVRIRNDVILILAFLVIAAAGMLYLFVFRHGGDTVKVTVDGEIYGIYPLNRNVSEEIVSGKDNECVNRFVILDGKAYMEYASCPDGICVDHRPVFRDGESIVCLPNRVVLTVITDNREDSVDMTV